MREEKPSIQKILVPTDFSRDSDQALDYAAVLAEKFKAEIFLAHVMESFTYSVSDTLTVVDHRKALKTIAQPLLDNLRKGLSEKGLSVKARLVDGVPYQEIIKVARKEKADLIVMGTHGRTGVGRLLLGSVAEKVVRLSACPVLKVRAPGGAPPRGKTARKK